MYLNIEYIHNKGFNAKEVLIMQLLKQNRSEDMENYLAMYLDDEMLEKFEKEGILNKVKKKRKADSDFSVMRLSKKGQEILENAETPELTRGDEDMYNYLVERYLDHEDKERTVGNKKKTKMYVAIFRNRLSLTLHQMYWLCMLYLDEAKYTKKLENVFFDGNKHRYGTFEGNFEDSPLYQYYDQNKERIENFWKKKDCL